MNGFIRVVLTQKPPKKCIGCRWWIKNKFIEDQFCVCVESPYYLRTCEYGCPHKEFPEDEVIDNV